MSDIQSKKALKAGVGYIVGNFLLKGIGFLTTPIFTRIMSQEDIGSFSNILTWVGILSILFTFDLYSYIAIARFDYNEDLNDFIASNLLLGSGITIAFFIVACFFRNKILSVMGIPEYAFYLAFAYMTVYPAIQMFQAKSQIEYKYKETLAISISGSVCSSIFAIFLVFLFENDLLGRIVGYFIPFIILGICVYIYLIAAAQKISCKYWKYALRISSPLVLHLLAGYVLSSSDRIMINILQNRRALGLYSVAYSCAMVVSVLMTSLNSAWVPWSMALIHENKIDKLKNTSKWVILLFVMLVFGIILIGPEILLVMGGKSYLDAVYVIPPVMIGLVFQFIYTLYVNIEQYFKKQKMIAIGTIIAALINIVLNWLLIPLYGYVAAAYTTLVSYIILFIVHYSFAKKIVDVDFYDKKFILFIICIALLLLPTANILYDFNIARYMLLGILLFAVIMLSVRYRIYIFKAIKEKSIAPVMQLISGK